MGKTHILGKKSAVGDVLPSGCRHVVGALPKSCPKGPIRNPETDLTRSVRDGVFGFITSGLAAFTGRHSGPMSGERYDRRFAI